jgi:hypothetical protein
MLPFPQIKREGGDLETWSSICIYTEISESAYVFGEENRVGL